MTPQAVTNVLLGLLSVGFPAVAFWYASRTNHIQARAEAAKAGIEEKGFDALVFERAAKLYQGLIDSLRVQVDRVEQSNRRLEAEVCSLRESNSNMLDEVNRLRAEIATLKRDAVK